MNNHDDKFENAKEKLIDKDEQTVETLRKYSRALISTNQAIKLLHLEHQGQLLDLLGMTNLPLPSLPRTVIDEMVNAVLSTSSALHGQAAGKSE